MTAKRTAKRTKLRKVVLTAWALVRTGAGSEKPKPEKGKEKGEK